eukprot:TRINITY_DN49022_c0_g1_i1.p1 TRINITY_DN49022_c0_g1~~TRINITY_DN49022_c0_g1_i1.p1  ORF type:complete len:335 (-),score=28.10 TRINITY_DN49022_c0_g1_i1:253-1257(-)
MSSTLCTEASCRVCHGAVQENGKDVLLSPCLCDGSVRWIHRKCLDHWRLQSSKMTDRATNCELCGYQYRFEMEWVSCADRLQRLLTNAACIAFPASGALALGPTSTQDMALCVGWAFFTWAAADMFLPYEVSSAIVRQAAPKLWTLCKKPLSVGPAVTAAATSTVVARCSNNSNSNRISHSKSHSTAVHDLELSRIEDLHSLTQQLRTEPLPSSVSRQSDIAIPKLSPTGTIRKMLLPAFLVITVPPSLLCVYVWQLQILFSSQLPEDVPFFVPLVSAAGSTYWLIAFFLLLSLSMLIPATCEPIRGPNGLELVRSLTPSERRSKMIEGVEGVK